MEYKRSNKCALECIGEMMHDAYNRARMHVHNVGMMRLNG
jgi:hypothetical protein